VTENDSPIQWRNLQLKFYLMGDPLLEEEECRAKFLQLAREPERDRQPGYVNHAVYMAEFNFDNIKRLSYQITEDSLQVVIQVYNPVPVRKRIRGQVNTVRSPFNMHNQSPFLNYWNVN
jgi:hypothetical protein